MGLQAEGTVEEEQQQQFTVQL
ncbi:unnamed protein product [Linum tenue]|uniref:Uncharacterized protein n=1 Tax=Linum tenue TaxID=586396 RepID=A0AAV0NPE2_9ROSI|nr:unnamed protein product [Linum tenue]CAI0460396.1 unnamed protein product [Linum tenue]